MYGGGKRARVERLTRAERLENASNKFTDHMIFMAIAAAGRPDIQEIVRRCQDICEKGMQFTYPQQKRESAA